MDLNRIGKFLQELRKEKGLTQEQLAEQMGVARRTVSRWETGSNMPDLDILVELSDLYEVDLREILSGERKSEQMNEELKDINIEPTTEEQPAEKPKKRKSKDTAEEKPTPKSEESMLRVRRSSHTDSNRRAFRES